MFQIPKLDFAPLIEIVRRRRWWIICPLILSLIGGGLYVCLTPKTYRASTMILVESQRVPTSYVKPTVTETLQSRLHTISQQIHSRTNIEKIIHQFGLAPKPGMQQGWLSKIESRVRSWLHLPDKKPASMSILDLVDSIRKRIEVSIRARNRAFEISFVWNDPKTAAEVANAIASQFIDQNLQVREEMAMGTTRFLDAEVDRLRRELQDKEKALEEFKRANMGKLPEQLESNLTILNQLKDELNNLEQRLSTEKQQFVMLRNQLAIAGPMLDLELDTTNSELDASGADSPELTALEARLRELRTRYTDKHPDVIALKRKIKRLKEEARAQAEKFNLKPDKQSLPAQGGQEDAMLKAQLAGFRKRIADYEKQIKKVREQIKIYQDRVENTSKVELQLRNLERDYKTVNKRYQDLLAKKLNAQMAEELEKRQKGEQFKVIDPAVPPDKPFKPNVMLVALMSLFLGLGMGGGLAFLRESLDPAFYSPEDIESYLPGVKVIVSLPWDEEIGN